MSTKEIRKLRHKFILVSLVSLMAAIYIIGGGIIVLMKVNSIRTIQRTLDYLVENRGIEEEDTLSENKMTFLEALLPQYNRYNDFYVMEYDSGGNVTLFESSRENVSEKVEAFISSVVLSAEEGYSNAGSFYVKVVENEDGSYTAAVLDCRMENAMLSRLFYMAMVICFSGFLLAAVLVWGLSKKAVQPEIENVNRQKMFITNASHELKTPLSVIRANTELLEMMNGKNEWTESTLSSVDRMNGLIQNLVMIARADEKESKGEVTSSDISTAVQESCHPFEAVAKSKGLTLTERIEENVVMNMSSADVRQLCMVLLDNAMKYCDENGNVVVALSKGKKKGSVVLEVSNSFASVEQTDLNHFFDRFYRSDTSHNVDQGGYGIGLSIAESIVEQYEGSIDASWKNGMIVFTCLLFSR